MADTVTGSVAASPSESPLPELDTHPFHLHGHHLQIVSFTPRAPGDSSWHAHLTLGEWRDTLPTLDGELVVRFAASRHVGEQVMHCHVLRHEDRGMMSSLYVCDPEAEGACPPDVLRRMADSQEAAAAAGSAPPRPPDLLGLIAAAFKVAVRIILAVPF